MLGQIFNPYLGETQYIAFLRANCLDLFPELVDQNQFNRRSRIFHQVVEKLRRFWIV